MLFPFLPFSPVAWLASASSDGVVKVWHVLVSDQLGFELAAQASGHLGRLFSLVRILVCSLLRIFFFPSFVCYLHLPGIESLDACSALSWSNKGNSFLISAAADTTLKVRVDFLRCCIQVVILFLTL
jgi:WD40 repeat protein